MTMYDQVRQAAQQKGVVLSDASVNRVVGTLRFAGVAALDSALAHEVESQAREAATAVEADTFNSIDSALKNGKCPRCGKAMKEVLLADKTPANYCSGTCRITLWKNEA